VSLCAGSDGHLWFSEVYRNRIGRITIAGVITEFDIPTPIPPFGYGPGGITAGPDGNLWFAEYSASRIAFITPEGQFLEFEIPTPEVYPLSPAVGPDGAIWFTADTSSHGIPGTAIGRFSAPARLPVESLEPRRGPRSVTRSNP
jgi:virginiamycin B lyase